VDAYNTIVKGVRTKQFARVYSRISHLQSQFPKQDRLGNVGADNANDKGLLEVTVVSSGLNSYSGLVIRNISLMLERGS